MYAKKGKYILSMFRKTNQIVKNKLLCYWAKLRKCHDLALKKLSGLLTQITSVGKFFCRYDFDSFAAENKRGSHKKVCENNFCKVVLSSEDIKMLDFSEYQKSNKAPFINYADYECLIETFDGCKNNPNKLSTAKASGWIPSHFAMPARLFFKTKTKHNVYRSKDCIRKFCERLMEDAVKIINFKKWS